MVDYARLAQTAARLIKNNGRSVTFARAVETPTDPAKPWNGSSSPDVTLALNGVFVPPNTVRQFGLPALGEGTEFRDLVTFSEQIIIVAQGEVDLREFSSVLDQGVRWGITAVQVLRPGEVTLIGFVGVRR